MSRKKRVRSSKLEKQDRRRKRKNLKPEKKSELGGSSRDRDHQNGSQISATNTLAWETTRVLPRRSEEQNVAAVVVVVVVVVVAVVDIDVNVVNAIHLILRRALLRPNLDLLDCFCCFGLFVFERFEKLRKLYIKKWKY